MGPVDSVLKRPSETFQKDISLSGDSQTSMCQESLEDIVKMRILIKSGVRSTLTFLTSLQGMLMLQVHRLHLEDQE